MTVDHTAEPLWINEPDWLCAVEFLNDADPESRDLAADTIGYLLGYSQLTNTRSLALIGDPELMAYEILFSFSSPAEKARFLDFIRSNDQLGNEYIVNDLIEPVKEEIRDAQPLAAVLPQSALARALMVATFVTGPIQPSVITLKPAIHDRVKSGHSEWAEDVTVLPCRRVTVQGDEWAR